MYSENGIFGQFYVVSIEIFRYLVFVVWLEEVFDIYQTKNGVIRVC